MNIQVDREQLQTLIRQNKLKKVKFFLSQMKVFPPQTNESIKNFADLLLESNAAPSRVIRRLKQDSDSMNHIQTVTSTYKKLSFAGSIIASNFAFLLINRKRLQQNIGLYNLFFTMTSTFILIPLTVYIPIAKLICRNEIKAAEELINEERKLFASEEFKEIYKNILEKASIMEGTA